MKNKPLNHQPVKTAFINPPKKIPLFLRLGILVSRKVTKRDLLVPKLLAWVPKVAISSGVLESLVDHGGRDFSSRMLKLIRIQTSLIVSCPFCIDMNSFGYQEEGITDEEMEAMRGIRTVDSVRSFSEKERVVLVYVRHLSASPIKMPSEVSDQVIRHFSEREIVILASTVAQVDYWARLIQGLGVPPEGFMDQCDI